MSRGFIKNKKQNPDAIFAADSASHSPVVEGLLLDDPEEITIDLFQLIRLVDCGKCQDVIARGHLVGGNAG